MGRVGDSSEQVVEFMPPEGLSLEGRTGSAAVEWEIGPSGSVRIIAFNGVPLSAGESPMPSPEGEMMDMEV